MPFNKDLVQPENKTSEKFINLRHGTSTITFAFKDCYSHFGVTHNKKFDNYSIPINVPDRLFNKLKQVGSKATTFLDEEPAEPILRSLVTRRD